MNLDKIVELLSSIGGVKAIALGGSQSRNEATEDSDYDLGLYYQGETLDIDQLEKCLQELDDDHRDHLLNPPGQWGPWINGGAWITVDGTPVDLLLRDVGRVEHVIRDCIQGVITIDYQSGHPFGFLNCIYAAETHYCRPLWQDESHVLDKLKSLLYSEGQYSPQMKEALVQRFLWEAWFSLACGWKASMQGDLNYAMGSAFRTVCAWLEVLYALNHRYLMNEKRALPQVKNLPQKPEQMEERVNLAYSLFTQGVPEKAYEILNGLHEEISELSRGIQQYETKIR